MVCACGLSFTLLACAIMDGAQLESGQTPYASFGHPPRLQSAIFLGDFLQKACFFLILFIGYDLFLYFRAGDRLAIPSIAFVVIAVVTILFASIGFFAARLYDAFLSICFVLYMVLREIMYAWQIACIIIFKIGTVDLVLGIILAAFALVYLFVGYRLAKVLIKSGAPDRLESYQPATYSTFG